jgi:DHA2 family methylenomycin A resistance protein-like MFS transporter
LDASIVNVGLEPIADGLATDVAGLQWVVNAYTLAFASLLLTAGTLGDRWGARRVYFAGLGVFTLASAICGLVPDLTALTIARVLQGIGASMLVPSSLKLINHAYPDPDKRAGAVGVWIGCGGIAMAAGPLVGGILIYFFGWRSIFFVNVPIGLIGIWLTWRIAGDTGESTLRHFDPAGQITAIIALGALIAVLIESSTLGWRSPPILAGIAVSALGWAGFLAIEARRTQPMLPLSFFENGIFSGSTFVSMASALVFYGLLFVFSLYYQKALGYSPLWAGLAFLPMTTMVAAGSMLSSRVVKHCGARGSMCAAFGFYAIGSMGMSAATSASSSYWLAVIPMVPIGLASGFISPAATAPAMGTVDKSRAGVAGAVLNSARQAGAALGVALFGTLTAALHQFEAGMHAALWVAAAISLLAATVWWFALGEATAPVGASEEISRSSD